MGTQFINTAFLASSILAVACGDDGDGGSGGIAFDSQSDMDVDAGEAVTLSIDGLDDAQAYRITLVVAANVTADGDGAGVFVDGDANGAADPGASENVALITEVNGAAVTGARTVPGAMDDPAAPTGVFPQDGTITLKVTGVAPGSVYPVAYPNAGQSTFLEVAANGTPTESYAVGGRIDVESGLEASPGDAQSIAVGSAVDYTVSGLDDAQFYRITLVVGANLTLGDDNTATFLDGDANGAADAGASEAIALISTVNGTAVANGGAKTVPGGEDNPAAPSGVAPSGGSIAFSVQGVAAGTVYPVIYRNGGMSTFLELDAGGAPIENYTVAAATTVQ